MKMISACLAGVNCKYNGGNNLNEKVLEIIKEEGKVILVCPEVMGGLPTPRTPAEIQYNHGYFPQKALVILREVVLNKEQEDVTKQFVNGAYRTLDLAEKNGVTHFIGKQKSPSCGCGQAYDGTFSGDTIKGNGITTTLLKLNGIEVITEEDL